MNSAKRWDLENTCDQLEACQEQLKLWAKNDQLVDEALTNIVVAYNHISWVLLEDEDE